MRKSSELLRAIRVEVFEETQERFGKRLQVNNETISRLESGRGSHRVTKRHLRWLKHLKAPQARAALLQELLQKMEAAIELETKVEAGMGSALAPEAVGQAMPAREEEGRSAPPMEAGQAGTVAKAEDAARRAEESLQRAEQLRLAEEARREEGARRVEEAVRRVEEVAERVERVRVAEEARRAEEGEQLRAAVRRVEEVAEQVERFRVAEEARRAEEAGKAAEAVRLAEQLEVARWRRVKRLAFGAVAASALLGILGGGAVVMLKAVHPGDGSGEREQVAEQGTGHEGAVPEREVKFEESPGSEQGLSSVDGGTEVSKLVRQAPADATRLSAWTIGRSLSVERGGDQRSLLGQVDPHAGAGERRNVRQPPTL